jgi:DNA-binding transcriptional regulator LsrR (DeoR family)
MKATLTPREKLKVAFGYFIQGLSQQDLAVQYEVNHGRINEAVTDDDAPLVLGR